VPYNKHKWVAPAGSNLNRFTKQNESQSSVDLTYNPSLTNTPTAFSAEWMNDIEDGIENAQSTSESAQAVAQSAESTAQSARTDAQTAMETAREALGVIQSGGGSGSVDISGKADKVSNATAGNIAALDANGNLIDSGLKPGELGGGGGSVDISGKADKVSNATSGNLPTLDPNGNLTNGISPTALTGYITAAPTANYSGSGSRLVYLETEPSTKYAGWIYLIKEQA